MKNLFRNKNIWIVIALILLIAIVALIGTQTRLKKHDLDNAMAFVTIEPTDAPTAEPTTGPAEAPAESAAAMSEPATATDLATNTDLATITDIILGINWRETMYLVVSTEQGTYRPQPLLQEGEFAIDQGEDRVNTVHVTTDGVYMAASTCENQDCVGQGHVTRENKEERILGNFILCLPNQVQLELLTFDEMVEAFGLSGFTYEQIVYLIVQPYITE